MNPLRHKQLITTPKTKYINDTERNAKQGVNARVERDFLQAAKQGWRMLTLINVEVAGARRGCSHSSPCDVSEASDLDVRRP